MSQSTQNKLSSKVLEKTISASIKKEIAAASINTTTRKGNKELKFLTSKIAKYPFDNIEQAQIAGAVLGKHIAEISQKRGQKNLDGGIIQQIHYQRGLFSLAGLSDEKLQSEPEFSQREDSTSASGEQPTEEIQSRDEFFNDETSSSPEESEVEATPEFQPSNELSSDEGDSSPDASLLESAEERQS